jgi:hypothetical protein
MGLPEWGHCPAWEPDGIVREMPFFSASIRDKLLQVLIRALMGTSSATGF